MFASFVLLFSILSFFEYFFEWNIPMVEISKKGEDSYASLKVPFIQLFVKFLLSYTVILLWFTMIFYAIYFYVLQTFFQIFIAEKTFTQNSIKKLTLFYKLNFIPVIIGFLGVILRYIIYGNLYFDEPHFFVLIHLIVAFFLYLYLDLIKKGNSIQQENDLTI
ncbi:hypothetical protein BTO18_16600 [Polaribacter porphyrae]|uniref:DUF2975 domain-containing protein n=1 Tax=Polaribacter porphyrae TaxID=1137780 RepID=A0A2S7WTP0_9FLAO|nr:hypothetical protein BTO18_16600 [Polaribacter porphyrae]